jgi:hypothetical protein
MFYLCMKTLLQRVEGMFDLSRESDSQKKRKKMDNDPSLKRGTFGDFDTFERKTPTLKKKQERKQNKYKNNKSWEDYED